MVGEPHAVEAAPFSGLTELLEGIPFQEFGAVGMRNEGVGDREFHGGRLARRAIRTPFKIRSTTSNEVSLRTVADSRVSAGVKMGCWWREQTPLAQSWTVRRAAVTNREES
jgi:hypothetical protein